MKLRIAKKVLLACAMELGNRRHRHATIERAMARDARTPEAKAVAELWRALFRLRQLRAAEEVDPLGGLNPWLWDHSA